MKRTVTINLSAEFKAATVAASNKTIEEATGYLSLWGYNPEHDTRDSTCNIFGQSDGSISAIITPNSGRPFELFALLSPDKQSYTFHS